MEKRRKFSPEDRLSILQEGEREGKMSTCRKYNLSPSLYSRWRERYLSKGISGLKAVLQAHRPSVSSPGTREYPFKKDNRQSGIGDRSKNGVAKKNFIHATTKKEMMSAYQLKVSKSNLLSWVNLPKSSYYYHSFGGHGGMQASINTVKSDGTSVENMPVVEAIKDIFSREFCCYGYRNVSSELRDKGYLINHKKVYRLMNENNLLLGKVIRTNGKRAFVGYRKIKSVHPFEYLCMDIKYVHVQGERRNYYLLSVMDIYTRVIVEQIFQCSIMKEDVINIFRRIKNVYGIKDVIIRNDNGFQFIANDVREYLALEGAKQEFTHISTPQENSYIEAFHSTVQREVIDRLEFNSFYEAKMMLSAHKEWYNNFRRHSTLKMTPMQKWAEYYRKHPQ
jgi:transposase InsO family protein